MRGSLSTALLLVLVIVAYENYAKGQLGPWLRAKFFNQPYGAGLSGAGVLQGGIGGGVIGSQLPNLFPSAPAESRPAIDPRKRGPQ